MNIAPTDRILSARDVPEIPWVGDAGRTRELQREGTAGNPLWRLLSGSTRVGGLWERLPRTHEAVLLGAGGPRVTVVINGHRRKLSGEHSLHVEAGADISVERDARAPRSELLMLIHRGGITAKLTMTTIISAHDTTASTRALIPIRGTVQLPSGDASPSTFAVLGDAVRVTAAAPATVVLVDIAL